MKKCLPLIFVLFPVLLSCSHQEIPVNNNIKIQKLNEFVLDGNFDEWTDVPFRKLYADPYGNSPEKEDLNARFKLAWKEKHLLLFVEIEDDSLIRNLSQPWKGDAIELFLSDFHGSENIVQYSVVTGGEDNNLHYTINDFRKKDFSAGVEPSLRGKTVYEENKVSLELEVDYDLFNSNSSPESIVVQLYVDDSDQKKDNFRNQLTWHPLGHSYMNSFAGFEVELTESENTIRNGTSRIVVTDEEFIELFVFGCKKGDEIVVKTNHNKELEFTSYSLDPHKPEIFELSELNADQDTAIVFVNGELIAIHDVFLSPRKNLNTEVKRFDREIRVFRKKDMLNMPEEGSVLFIGSSSIRMWNTLHGDFPDLNSIHRGFGGSTSEDVLKYMDYIVLPYKPSAIVYYEGDNDIPQGMTYEEIILNMRIFIKKTMEQNPQIKIYMISPKPSIRRMLYWDKYTELHKRMKILTDRYNSVYFVDVASPMFKRNGKLNEELFIQDGIHMNETGYDIWKQVLNEKMDLTLNE